MGIAKFPSSLAKSLEISLHGQKAQMMKETAKVLMIFLGLAAMSLLPGLAAAATVTATIVDNTWVQPWYLDKPAVINGYPAWDWTAVTASAPKSWEINKVEVTWGGGGNLRMQIYTNYPQSGLEGAGQADIGLDRNRDGIFEAGIKMSGRELGRIYTVYSWKTAQDIWGSDGGQFYSGRYAMRGTTDPALAPYTVIDQGTNDLGEAKVTFRKAPKGSGSAYLIDIKFPVGFNTEGDWNDFNFLVASGSSANDVLAGRAQMNAPLSASVLLLGTGLLGLALWGRRKKV